MNKSLVSSSVEKMVKETFAEKNHAKNWMRMKRRESD